MNLDTLLERVAYMEPDELGSLMIEKFGRGVSANFDPEALGEIILIFLIEVRDGNLEVKP